MNIIDKLRYQYVRSIKSLAHMQKVKEAAIEQLIGHTKIIGWESGLPVRALAIPAEYSDINAAMTAKLYNSLRPQTRYPGLLWISVTARCECACAHCYAAGQNGTDLSAEKWKSVIAEGIELGAFTCIFTGGEPLLREDLPELIAAVDKRRAISLVYTNGYALAERIDELYAAGLRRVAISVDFSTARQHDEHRQMPGLFERLMRGAAAAKKKGMLVGLSTFASPERIASGELERIFQLAADHQFNEILVYDLLPAGKLLGCHQIGTNSEEYLSALRQIVARWWRDQKAPGLWWYGHVSAYNNLGCSGGSTMVGISHDGKVKPCDFSRMDVGSVTEDSLLTLWYKLQLAVEQQKVNGCQCLLQKWS